MEWSAFNTKRKIQHRTIQNKKYKTHVQREVELYSPELSMTEKLPKKKSVDIWPTPFQNDDPIYAQLDNTGNVLVELQPKPQLNSIV